MRLCLILQYGGEPVLIQQLFIDFEAILDYYIFQLSISYFCLEGYDTSHKYKYIANFYPMVFLLFNHLIIYPRETWVEDFTPPPFE